MGPGGSICGCAHNLSHVPHPLSPCIRRGHSACFHVSTVVTSATVTVGCRRRFETVVAPPPGGRPGEGLPGHAVVLFLIFQGTSVLVSMAAAPAP